MFSLLVVPPKKKCLGLLLNITMKNKRKQAQHELNKRSFKEVLEEVYGCPVSEQEAFDALFNLTELMMLLDQMDREQQRRKLK